MDIQEKTETINGEEHRVLVFGPYSVTTDLSDEDLNELGEYQLEMRSHMLESMIRISKPRRHSTPYEPLPLLILAGGVLLVSPSEWSMHATLAIILGMGVYLALHYRRFQHQTQQQEYREELQNEHLRTLKANTDSQ